MHLTVCGNNLGVPTEGQAAGVRVRAHTHSMFAYIQNSYQKLLRAFGILWINLVKVHKFTIRSVLRVSWLQQHPLKASFKVEVQMSNSI